MSGKETKLDDLNVELSKEEEDIVDSIISELNDGPQEPPPQQRPPQQQRPPNMPPQQQQMPPQQIPPQQMPPQQMPPPQQRPNMNPNMPPNMNPNMNPNMDPNIMQQKMMQQQMQQQMMQQQMMKKMAEEKEEDEDKKLSFMDKLKIDMKEPTTVMFITLLMLLPQTNSLITSTKLSFLMNADGSINLYGLMIKAILAGVLFFLAQKYV